MAGAATAFLAVERLILRACARTLDFASTIEVPPAVVDLHRTNEEANVTLGAACTRIREAGKDMVTGEPTTREETNDLREKNLLLQERLLVVSD